MIYICRYCNRISKKDTVCKHPRLKNAMASPMISIESISDNSCVHPKRILETLSNKKDWLCKGKTEIKQVLGNVKRLILIYKSRGLL